jgi:iron-sulfur cluster assembly accessory protein
MATTVPMITITERAAVKVREFMAAEGAGAEVLRLAVQGGGCSGFQYALGFDEGPADGDLICEMHGVRVVIDPFSLPYLNGSGVDYVDGLNGTGFQIDNPNVVAGCGCGSSFQVKDEEGGEIDADAAGGCGTCASH